MKLRRAARNWDAFAEDDPLWAILTWDEKRGGRWDPDEFFATGVEEVAGVLARVEELRPGWLQSAPSDAHRALDFGCGVGRLSRALAARFDEVHGVDIAPAMVEAGRRFDVAGEVEFHVHREPDLSLFADGFFRFLYSSITLQHLEPRFIEAYLDEFARVLAPDGVMVFQLPSEPRRPPNPSRWKHRLGVWGTKVLRRARGLWDRRPVMDMHGLPREAVVARLQGLGLAVWAVDESGLAGEDWNSWVYVASR